MSAPFFPHLFEPIRVGPMTLRHRMVMGSMHTGLEDRAEGYPQLAAFYSERVREGVDLIVTGGIGPSPEALGRPEVAAYSTLYLPEQVAQHQVVTQAVHQAGGHILLQIVHVGRYDHASGGVSPSSLVSKLSNRHSRELDASHIEAIIDSYVQCARLAHAAGYDGVEVMGGEGYLINQFLAPITNFRADQWGNDAEGRKRFALRIVRSIRHAVPRDFVVSFRLSLIDLVQHGSLHSEMLELARDLEGAGVDLFNTSVGWHEARVPTVAAVVPRAAFGWAVQALREVVQVPVAASNRINTPHDAEALLAAGQADMVAMARPFLADPSFVRKAALGQASHINTCVACNQACLDHIFIGKTISCMVNPRAGREWEWPLVPALRPRRIAVVGAGPAGLACAREAALRGHRVTVFERARQLGGQLHWAQRIPGKQEFADTLHYFTRELQRLQVQVHLATHVQEDTLCTFDHVVLATGSVPQRSAITGENHAKVLDYLEALRDPHSLGPRVAIIGAGPMGFDIAQLLSQSPAPKPTGDAAADAAALAQQRAAFLREWGVDPQLQHRGGLTEPQPTPSAREIWLLQRSTSRPGHRLGVTTAWIHRTQLQRRGVRMFQGVEYQHIDDAGLHLRLQGAKRCLSVDHIVLCTGQEPYNPWAPKLTARGMSYSVIGSAHAAHGMDATLAFRDGAELGRQL